MNFAEVEKTIASYGKKAKEGKFVYIYIHRCMYYLHAYVYLYIQGR